MFLLLSGGLIRRVISAKVYFALSAGKNLTNLRLLVQCEVAMVHRELLKLGLARQSQQKGVDRLLLFIEPFDLQGLLLVSLDIDLQSATEVDLFQRANLRVGKGYKECSPLGFRGCRVLDSQLREALALLANCFSKL